MQVKKSNNYVMWLWVVLVALVAVHGCAKKEPVGDTSRGSDLVLPTLAEGMAALPIELPRPMFVGTPANVKVDHLETFSDKARPPFLAPTGVRNVALNKPVTSSVEETIMGELSWITDGDKEGSETSLVELDPFSQSITVDLETQHEIYAVLLWHYHKQKRVYFDVIVQVADDADFIENVATIFNNDIDNSSLQGVGEDMHYIESYQGKLIDAKGVKGRFVRLFSNGNNANDQNTYLEVEVFGKPVE